MASSTGTQAATGPHELEALAIAGFKGTPEEIERQWFEQVYRGRGDSMKQLTLRAVVMGSLLGGVLSLTNLYIGLKAGWAFGVAITACILSYSIWTGLLRIRLARTPMSILENNCMQSTASAAGYSTGGTLISAFAAYMVINNATMDVWLMMGWVFCLAVIGVTMAIPMKRQMINIEQLRFPSGIAAAETLRALHSTGAKGMRSARALAWAGLGAAVGKFWSEGLVLLGSKPDLVKGDTILNTRLEPFQIGTWVNQLNESFFGRTWMGRTVMLSYEPMFIAAGMITGWKVCWSTMLGSIVGWMVMAPWLQAHGYVPAAGGYRAIVTWLLWGGVACMVSSSLLSFGMQWKTAARAFTDLGSMFGSRKSGDDPMTAIEAPSSWFVGGQLFGFCGLAWLGHITFRMPVWQTAIAVLLSFVLTLVASRVTGETDTTPVGSMGKITQLTFGLISPGNMNINLMSANVTANSASCSADLLTDLKSGYLLGANPRQQFLAQFAGIFMGTVVTVLSFRLLVPNASVLGGDQFPAPAMQTWRAVAIALSHGLSGLEPVKRAFILWGAIVGVGLTVLPMALPRHKHLIPSPAGVGLAWTFHWYYGFLMFAGGGLGLLLEKKAPKWSEEFTFPVASGWIAGESLMGVVNTIWQNWPGLAKAMFTR
jgi:OPT family oligopeptide transporter